MHPIRTYIFSNHFLFLSISISFIDFVCALLFTDGNTHISSTIV